MERVGINSYTRTIGINPKPSKKTGICIHLHKGLRKGAKTFFFSIETTPQKTKGIYLALSHLVFATMLK